MNPMINTDPTDGDSSSVFALQAAFHGPVLPISAGNTGLTDGDPFGADAPNGFHHVVPSVASLAGM